MLYDVSPYF